LFLFFGVLFFGQKRHPHFCFFSFFGTKMAVKKQKKKVSTLAEPMHGGQSHLQPQLSTSPPKEHEYCEAVSTELSLLLQSA